MGRTDRGESLYRRAGASRHGVHGLGLGVSGWCERDINDDQLDDDNDNHDDNQHNHNHQHDDNDDHHRAIHADG